MRYDVVIKLSNYGDFDLTDISADELDKTMTTLFNHSKSVEGYEARPHCFDVDAFGNKSGSNEEDF